MKLHLSSTWLWILVSIAEITMSSPYTNEWHSLSKRQSDCNEKGKVNYCYESDFRKGYEDYGFIHLVLKDNVPELNATIETYTDREGCKNTTSRTGFVISNNTAVIHLPLCCTYRINFADLNFASCINAFQNHPCKQSRTINVTVEEVWNPEGYYKYSAKFSMQFDPLLLNSLESITIQVTIEPGGRILVKERIQPKKLDSQLIPDYPFILQFVDGCDRLNESMKVHSCKDACNIWRSNDSSTCQQECINATSYTYTFDQAFPPLLQHEVYQFKVIADKVFYSSGECKPPSSSCEYSPGSFNITAPCHLPSPPRNVTASDCVVNKTECHINVSWERNNELDLQNYVVFVHFDTVNDTFVGHDGKYLTEKEHRFPIHLFPANTTNVQIMLDLSPDHHYYVQVRGNNSCTENLLETWSDPIVIKEVVYSPEMESGMATVWFYIIGGCSLFTIIVGMFTTCCIVLYCKQQNQSPIIDELNVLPDADEGDMTLIKLLPNDEWEVNNTQVLMPEQRSIGKGNFCEVYKGIFHGQNKRQLQNEDDPAKGFLVAVKLLPDDATETDKSDFLKEIKLMKKVSTGLNPYVINMVGCCMTQEPLALIIDFAPNGNLLTFLRAHKKERIDARQVSGDTMLSNADIKILLKYGLEISCGMEYLGTLNIIHRDLACRNVLVGNDYTMKVSDFGLSRTVYADPVYVQTGDGKLPIRWMAIESIIDRNYTLYSDVWSFGVVLWEIFTHGSYPYPTLNNAELVASLMDGERLDCPNNCPQTIYYQMMCCWNPNPFKRPTFSQLKTDLEALLNSYSQEKYELLSEMDHQNIVYEQI
ncbi:fibroblast growth factor receptor 3-like [Dysidea avara]|uniref:fibroblast growth factor receptor 3-like n=1 Tax=Dysidea avara TaxID=196820 RepID=UPI003317B67A